jgi:hypothetical protein
MSRPVLTRAKEERCYGIRACQQGRHSPASVRCSEAGDFPRSHCRYCGAELVQLFARSWIVSGMLG